VYGDERHGLPRRHDREDDGEVAAQVQRQQAELEPSGSAGRAQQFAHARHVEIDALEQEQREEHIGLRLGPPCAESPALGRLTGGEHQRAVSDVGILLRVIGVRVVASVFRDPPAEAEADAEVAVQQAQDPAGTGGPEDLAVPGIVAEEAHLGEHRGQEHRHDELVPGVPEHDNGGPAGGEEQRQHDDGGEVVAASTVEQAGRLDMAGQLGVVTASCGGLRPAPVVAGRPDGRWWCQGHEASSVSAVCATDLGDRRRGSLRPASVVCVKPRRVAGDEPKKPGDTPAHPGAIRAAPGCAE
jgi:hypothetical protein